VAQPSSRARGGAINLAHTVIDGVEQARTTTGINDPPGAVKDRMADFMGKGAQHKVLAGAVAYW
jgi:hypothetical protein